MSLTLEPLDLAAIDALDAAPEGTHPPLLLDVARAQRALYLRTGAKPPWIGYLAVGEGGTPIGSCSFVGPPRDGSVEIAYFTFPGHEGRGLATAMAGELLCIAARSGLDRIHAFTLPVESPSSHILARHGFVQVGEAEDEEAGTVWRWERHGLAPAP